MQTQICCSAKLIFSANKLYCRVAVHTDIYSVPDASQQILNLDMHLFVPQLNFFPINFIYGKCSKITNTKK